MIAQGELRLSAYLSWWPMFFGLPRYNSARMLALRKSRPFSDNGDVFAAEHGNHDGTEFRLGVELAEHRQRGLQPRNADGKSGRRHRLAAKTRDQPVITPAAADRAEANRAAFFVLGLDQQFNFKNGAGVIFETADDGRIDLDPLSV